MSQKPILYSLDFSPSARTVLLTAEYIGLELEIRNVDINKNEQMSETFLQMNPQHTVPTLDDNGVYLWESAPICTYLISKYGPVSGCPLYPSDPVQRARIDQRLYFNAGILFPLLRSMCVHVLRKKQTQLKQSVLDGVRDAFDLLENFLHNQCYLVGATVTLADLAIATTVTNILEFATLGKQHYRIAAWLERIVVDVPYFNEINAAPVTAYGKFFHAQLASNLSEALADKDE